MSADDHDSAVLIIGGGAAGLSTAAACARRGIRTVVLEQDDYIGGSWSRRYQCLKLHTIRRFSGLAYYPIPDDRPQYLSKDEYATYLKLYADELGLDVSLGERVQSIREKSVKSGQTEWEVETNLGLRKSKVVVVATGNCAEARQPNWKGIDKFTGDYLHSSEYADGTVFRGKKVLVIGLGNSGAEIAADLAKNDAETVSVSVRATPPVVTREMFKIIPVQLFGIVFSKLGIPGFMDRMGEVLRRFSIGDLSSYGLGKAAWGPFTARKPAVIDAGFLKQLKMKRVVVRPEVISFDATGIIYADDTREDFDAVIAATGFRTGLEKILKKRNLLEENGQPKFRSGGPTPVQGIFFIGFDETIRGQLFEINRESKTLAVEIDNYLKR